MFFGLFLFYYSGMKIVHSEKRIAGNLTSCLVCAVYHFNLLTLNPSFVKNDHNLSKQPTNQTI